MAEENKNPEVAEQPAIHPDVIQTAQSLGFSREEMSQTAGYLQIEGEALDNILADFEPENNILAPAEEFTGMLDISTSKFMNESTVEEVSTAQAISETGLSADLDTFIEINKGRNRGTGVADVSLIREQNVNASKEAFFELEGDPANNLEAVQEDVELEQTKPELLVLYEETVKRLHEEGVSEKALELITVSSGMFERRQLDDILAVAMTDQFNNSGIDEITLDVVEVFTDVYGASDRMQRRQVVDKVNGESSTLTDYNFYRSSDIRDITDKGFNNLPFDDQRKLLLSIIDAVEQSESLIGNNNALYSVAMLDELREALVDNYGKDDWVSWFEAAGLVATPITFLKTMKSFVKAGSLKMMKMRDAYYGLDVTDEMDDVLSATQEFIKTFDPNTGENVIEVVKESKEGYTLIRMGNSKLGNVTNAVSPRTLAGVGRQAQEAGTTNKVFKSLGFDEDTLTLSSTVKTQDTAATGINPRTVVGDEAIPTSADLAGRKSAVELFQERPLGLVLSAKEIQSAPRARFARMDTLMGDSASFHADKSDLVSNETGFTMVGRFGQSDTEGYHSFDEAATAASNLTGEKPKIVVKSNTNVEQFTEVDGDIGPFVEYFIEVPVSRNFSPTDGVQFLDGSTWGSADGLARVFGSHSDRISQTIINDFSLLKDFNVAVSDRLQGTLKPYASTHGAERDTVNTILELGDKNQVAYSLAEVSEIAGKQLTRDSRIWKAYQSARQYYDDLADINDMRVRTELEKRGFKNVNVRDHYGNKVWGKPITADEARATGAKEVYDIELQGKDTIGELPDNLTYVQLKTPITSDGEDFTIVIRDVSRIEALPQRVIPRRAGYVNLAYKDQGAIIKLATPRTLNGVVTKGGGQEVLYFADDVKDAEKWLNKTAEGSTKSNRELLLADAGDDAELVVSETREALFEMATLEPRNNGTAVPYNLRGRKDAPVQTVRGDVEILDMENRINKSMRSMENTLNRDALQILKQRFVNQFGGYLRDRTSFPESPRLDGQFRMDKTGIVADEATRKNMENLHNYIIDMERLQGYRNDSRLDQPVNSVLKALKLDRGRLNVLDNVKALASFMVIYGRPIYQTLANSSQMLTFSARDPIRGTASIMETAAAAPAIALRRTGRDVNWDMYAKFAGFPSGKDMTKWIDSLETSGVFSASKLDNLLSNFDKTRKLESKNRLKRATDVALDTPRLAQAMATDLTNLVAYRHAVKLAKERFPSLDPYSKAGLKNVHNLFRELTLNMNKTDAVIAETSNVLSLPLLWTQHVYKGWKQIVAKPAVKAITGADIGKSKSLWAEDWPQAVTTTAMNLFMFGGAGLVGTEWILDLDEMARKKGIIDKGESLGYWFYEGAVDLMVKDALGVDINSAERISFGDAPQMMLSLTGLDEGTLNVFGGTAISFTRIGQFAETLKVMSNTPMAQEEDMFELLRFLGGEGLSVFTGYSDYEKARLVKNFGLYFSSGGNPLYSVDPEAELGALASFRPDDAALRERILFDGKSGGSEEKFYTKTIPQTFSRWFWDRMNRFEEKGELTFEVYSQEIQKFYRYIDAATANTGASAQGHAAKQAFSRLAIDPTGLFTDAEMLAKNQILVERMMDNYSHSEAKAKLEQIISLADDEKLRSQAETMLDVLNLQHELLGGTDG